MLIRFLDILSRLREWLWGLRLFLIVFLNVPLVDVLISKDLLKQDLDLLLMISVFLLQLSL
jgi:hypothetical protein